MNKLKLNEMPHFKEFLDPNFLANIDFLDDKGVYQRKVVTIKDVTKEMVHNGKGDSKPEMTVHTIETKPFILSKKNLKTIIKLTRKVNTDDWKGERIELYIAENVKAFGELFDVVRVAQKKLAPTVKPDYSAAIKSIQSCTTLEQLQAVYMSLSPDAKTAVVNQKDEMKQLLTVTTEAGL